jgi:hypothetical protein
MKARLFTTRLLLAIVFVCSLSGAQQQWRPTHVVVIFDTTKSFWRNLHIAHAITERLLREIYYSMPGHPDDALTFIVLNAEPTIVTELSGLDLRRKAARKFIEAFGKPDPRLGTDVVTALELADLAFSRHPQSLKFLFIFSDLIVDPARTPQGGLIPFRPLTDFDWHRFHDVSIWVFLCPSRVEMTVKRAIPALNQALFFSPPPMTNGIVEKENLQAFTAKVAQKFQKELMQRLQALPSDSAESANPFKFLGILIGALITLLGLLLGLSKVRRR